MIQCSTHQPCEVLKDVSTTGLVRNFGADQSVGARMSALCSVRAEQAQQTRGPRMDLRKCLHLVHDIIPSFLADLVGETDIATSLALGICKFWVVLG